MKRVIKFLIIVVPVLLVAMHYNDFVNQNIFYTGENEVLTNGEVEGDVVTVNLDYNHKRVFLNAKNRLLVDGCRASIGDVCAILNDDCPAGMVLEVKTTSDGTNVTKEDCK